MTDLTFVLTFATAIGCGVVGGVFFAFSTFVTDGLNRVPAPAAVAAMQGINIAAPRPPFMLPFLGTGLLCLLVAGAAVVERDGAASWLSLSGAILYLIGSIAVTIRFNIPLNNQIDKAPTDDPEADEAWASYLRPWRTWNHVRTISSTVACAALITSLTI